MGAVWSTLAALGWVGDWQFRHDPSCSPGMGEMGPRRLGPSDADGILREGLKTLAYIRSKRDGVRQSVSPISSSC